MVGFFDRLEVGETGYACLPLVTSLCSRCFHIWKAPTLGPFGGGGGGKGTMLQGKFYLGPCTERLVGQLETAEELVIELRFNLVGTSFSVHLEGPKPISG